MRSIAALLVLSAVVLTVVPPAQAAHAPVPWRKMQRAINEVRHAHGLPRLQRAVALRRAARGHSADMFRRRYFGHVSPAGSTLSTRIRRAHFRTVGSWSAGEVIAWGGRRNGRVGPILRGWLGSPVHRSILLSPSYRLIGIGRVRGAWRGYGDARIWTAVLGQR